MKYFSPFTAAVVPFFFFVSTHVIISSPGIGMGEQKWTCVLTSSFFGMSVRDGGLENSISAGRKSLGRDSFFLFILSPV
jgi:hypothetical protein